MRGTMTDEPALREHLRKLLDWQEAHVGFDKAVADIPAKLRGEKPAQLPYSAWQLIEHLRITQHDILDFCRNPKYEELHWPDDYWPASPAPRSAAAWDTSIRRYRQDPQALRLWEQPLVLKPAAAGGGAPRTSPSAGGINRGQRRKKS